MDKKPPPTLQDLYPSLSAEELAQAEETFDRYMALVKRIHDRIRSDPESYPQFRALLLENGTLPCTSPRSSDPPTVPTS